LRYNKTINDNDALKHIVVIIILFALCVELQIEKNDDEVKTLLGRQLLCCSKKKQ